jgi:hypothetical protein
VPGANCTRIVGQPIDITKIGLSIKFSGAEFGVTVEGPQAKRSFDLQQQVEAPDITFLIKERLGKKARGRLWWPAKQLSSNAVSGDSGHDAIDIGLWQGIAFQEKPGNAPFCDKANNCWLSVFRDAFGRTELGIHPDGGTPDATLGCIGIEAADTRSWHDALKSVNGRITCEVKNDVNVGILADDSVFEIFDTQGLLPK